MTGMRPLASLGGGGKKEEKKTPHHIKEKEGNGESPKPSSLRINVERGKKKRGQLPRGGKKVGGRETWVHRRRERESVLPPEGKGQPLCVGGKEGTKNVRRATRNA